MNRFRDSLCVLLTFSVFVASTPVGVAYAGDAASSASSTSSTPVMSAQPTQQQLQQLVAPIALYPDSLVAQILAASTYPDQVVQADRWLQEHKDLQGEQLGQAVDQQPWDPSVKALTEFPSVLANMDKNLSWTSSLGDAYINNQQAVMNAVQDMREKAQKAGNLKSDSQVKVVDQGQTIIIQPANPEVVYVPEFDPWIVYGYPVSPWPGWYWYPGLYWTSPGIAFGLGFGVGFFGGFAWGWPGWGFDWHRGPLFHRGPWISHSRVVVNRNYYVNRASVVHGGGPAGFRGGNAFRGDGHFGGAPHAFAGPHAMAGGHVGAFGGFDHGGVVRGYSARGFSHMGASGGFHGGGFHGGGFHGGGGHR